MGKLQIGRSYNNNLRVGGKFPLDDREVVEYIADLTTVNTWLTETGFNASYIGMVTFCLENQTRYELIGTDVTNSDNWRVVGKQEDLDFQAVVQKAISSRKTIDVTTSLDADYLSFAGFQKDQDGIMHCVYRFGRNHMLLGGIAYVYSRDNGDTWSEPQILLEAGQTNGIYTIDYRDCKLLQISGDEFFISGFYAEYETENTSERRNHLTLWSINIHKLFTGEFDVDNSIYRTHNISPTGIGAASGGGLAITKDKEILWTIYMQELVQNGTAASYILKSIDKGVTFGLVGQMNSTKDTTESSLTYNGEWYSILRPLSGASVFVKSSDLKTWTTINTLDENYMCPTTIKLGDNLLVCARLSNRLILTIIDALGIIKIEPITLATNTVISDIGYAQFTEDVDNIYLQYYDIEESSDLVFLTIPKSDLSKYLINSKTFGKINDDVSSFTQAEWNALTTEQQNSYKLAIVT